MVGCLGSVMKCDLVSMVFWECFGRFLRALGFWPRIKRRSEGREGATCAQKVRRRLLRKQVLPGDPGPAYGHPARPELPGEQREEEGAGDGVQSAR